jgi:hypothetical protein
MVLGIRDRCGDAPIDRWMRGLTPLCRHAPDRDPMVTRSSPSPHVCDPPFPPLPSPSTRTLNAAAAVRDAFPPCSCRGINERFQSPGIINQTLPTTLDVERSVSH